MSNETLLAIVYFCAGISFACAIVTAILVIKK